MSSKLRLYCIGFSGKKNPDIIHFTFSIVPWLFRIFLKLEVAITRENLRMTLIVANLEPMRRRFFTLSLHCKKIASFLLYLNQ